jgi:hypothetical protein
MNDNQKHRWLVVSAALLIVLVACLYFLPRPKPSHLVVTLSGTPGVQVHGYWVTDGVTNLFRGTMPTNFDTLQATQSVSFELVRESGQGVFSVTLTPPGSRIGSFRGETDYGLRGYYNLQSGERSLNSFSKQ